MSGMIRTFISQNAEWFADSDPYSNVGDMDSEIAELRTLTKVTRLRRQIECREEGSWMVVKDVPDDNAPSGSRTVTSFATTRRSVVRSVSSNVHFDDMFNERLPSHDSEPVVQLPHEHYEKSDAKPTSVEITEVFDEPLKVDAPRHPKENSPERPTNKKTSVVTLGKGNLVLINPEDETNFHVTGISKGKVADAVSTLERNTEKKVKKVGFCKTEVHFAPDSGKINIVETDEKPPPTQVYRKKKRIRQTRERGPASDLPKHYFGEVNDFSGEESNMSNESDKEDSRITVNRTLAPTSKQIYPKFERTIQSEGKDTKYRHSSPEKNESEFDLQMIQNEEKEFCKRVKQPTYRNRLIKETDTLAESFFKDNLDDDVKSMHNRIGTSKERFNNEPFSVSGFNRSPAMEDLYTVQISAASQKPLFKSLHNRSLTSPTSDYFNKDTNKKIDPLKVTNRELRYTELLRHSAKKENKTTLVNDKSNIVKNVVQGEAREEDESGTIVPPCLDEIVLHVTEQKSRIPIDQDVKLPPSFLNNISPKLKNLIKNSVEHEFQLRQKQILQRRSTLKQKDIVQGDSSSVVRDSKSSRDVTPPRETNKKQITIAQIQDSKPKSKTVTKIHLDSRTKNEFQTKREQMTKTGCAEPIYDKDKSGFQFKEAAYLVREGPVPAPRALNLAKSKRDTNSRQPPKPKPRTLASGTVGQRDRSAKTVVRPPSQSSIRGDTSRTNPKETIIRIRTHSSAAPSLQQTAQQSTSISANYTRSTPTKSTVFKSDKASKHSGKKLVREPLRSFEKVSNGWVGHIVPVKQTHAVARQSPNRTISRQSITNKTTATAHHSLGSRRSTAAQSSNGTLASQGGKLNGGRASNKFSLSKEHLTSAKLVKQVSPGRKVSVSSASAQDRTRGGGGSRRRRRDSHDSLVEADEEVRAYMTKVDR